MTKLLVAAIVIVLILGGGYYIVSQKKSAVSPANSQKQTQAGIQQVPQPTQPAIAKSTKPTTDVGAEDDLTALEKELNDLGSSDTNFAQEGTGL